MYGLLDWLSSPTPGRHQCCQCIGLRTRKTILVISLLAVVISSAVLFYLLINRFAIPIAQLANGVLLVLELSACLLLIVALYSERWHFVVPLIAAEALHLIVWTSYVVYYVVLIVRNKIDGNGGEITAASIVVPGAPSFGLGNTDGEPFSNDIYTKTIGHILLVIAIHIILLWTAFSIYRAYRYKRTDVSKDHACFMPSPVPAHNVIVLEQPIEEAMYGKKATTRNGR